MFHGAVFGSADNGTSWKELHYFGPNTPVRAVASAGAVLYAGTAKGAFKSADDGRTWKPACTGMAAGSDVQALLVAADGTLYAGTTEGGLKCGRKDHVWRKIGGVPGREWVRSFAAAPDGTLYAGTWSGIFRSTGAGQAWKKVHKADSDTDTEALLVTRDGTVYAGTEGNGIYRSTDKGRTWKKLAAEFNVQGLVETREGGILAATTGGVYRSTNMGVAWRRMSKGLANGDVVRLVAAPDGSVFAGLHDGGVQKLRERGPEGPR